MRKLSAVFLALIVAQIARAEREVVSSTTEPSGVSGIQHRHLILRGENQTATIDLAEFPSKSGALRVIDNANGEDDLAGVMKGGKFIAGVNGGYFDPQFRPLGLRIIDGKTISPLTRARLLTGVLSATARGITINRVGEFSRGRRIEAAIECGPLLVDRGMPVAKLDDRRSARRTFVAVARAESAALGVSSGLTLAQLANVLVDRSIANDFKIWRALNLDGGSSSTFWFRKSDGSVFSISEDKAVRDFVGVAAK